jgi:hypothetical protein
VFKPASGLLFEGNRRGCVLAELLFAVYPGLLDVVTKPLEKNSGIFFCWEYTSRMGRKRA